MFQSKILFKQKRTIINNLIKRMSNKLMTPYVPYQQGLENPGPPCDVSSVCSAEGGGGVCGRAGTAYCTPPHAYQALVTTAAH